MTLQQGVDSGMDMVNHVQYVAAVMKMNKDYSRVMHQDAISGTLEPGKKADLIIVQGDPLTHISDLRNVKTVIKDGRVYDPVVLRRLVGFAK